MKRKALLLFSVLLSSFFLFSACTKEKNSSDGEIIYKIEPVNMTASIGTTVSESGITLNLPTNSSFTWKAGYLTISELNLEANKDNRDIEFKLKKSSTIDLFKLNQDVGTVHVPPGSYDEIEIELILNKQTTGNVLAISGDYKDESGKITPLEFNFNEGMTFKLQVEDQMINASTDYTGLLTLQLNRFLANLTSLDLITASKNVNGIIVVSNTSNIELFSKVRAGFMSSVKADIQN